MKHGWCDNPQTVALLAEAENYAKLLYSDESNHILDITSYRKPNVNFISVWIRKTRDVVACGAVVLSADKRAEIKSIFVKKKTVRRYGLARRILKELENIASHNGAALLVLETGVKQHAAIALYKNYGFNLCGPFHQYKEDPLSIFMEREIEK